ncbi:MAG TPA: DUF4190 domain-containing protein [Planctomycetota bacterium]|nr:DUF4190 domain-containing protein [Planctomycetota bacterium]
MADHEYEQPRSNGLAIAALICGIIGILIFPVGIVGLVLGIVALTQGQNKGMAVTGIVLGGLALLVVPIAIIAAIAIPNLLESRVTANEASAAATLKSAIFPAEIQFQSGAYADADGDAIGEYGSLRALNGDGRTLIAGPLAHGDVAHGYRFAIFVPDETDLAERHFVAYAWPVSPDMGRRVFALTSAGNVHSVAATDLKGQPPSWDTALGGGTWGDPVTWPVHTR